MSLNISQFFEQLQAVATSPYALVGYLAVVVLWAVVALKTARIKTLAGVIKLLPENERKALLEKEYGFHLKEGMSAVNFLKAQRATYIFYGFVAVVVAALIIAIAALLKPAKELTDVRKLQVCDSIGKIVVAAHQNFQSLLGPEDRNFGTDPQEHHFLSKVSLPDSLMNHVTDKKGDREFSSWLYFGPDRDIGLRIYRNFFQDFRECTQGWIETSGLFHERNEEVRDYTTFIRGKWKAIVTISAVDNSDYAVHFWLKRIEDNANATN